MTYPTTPIELTLREQQVLALYAQGIRRKQIVKMLRGISSVKTVDSTLDRIQERLSFKDRWQLRDYARANGFDKMEVAG